MSPAGFVRHLNGLLFTLQAVLWITFRRRFDVYLATSIPPIFPSFLIRLVSFLKGGAFIYYLQDKHPEMAAEVGLLKAPWLIKLLGLIDGWTLRKADLVVTLSEDMSRTIQGVGVNPLAIRLINNISPKTPAIEPPATRSGPVRFVFAGNIGRFQNLERLVEVFADFDPNEIVLELLGEGALKEKLAESVGKRTRAIRFHDAREVDDAFDFVSRCDVGIVSLAPGLYRYAYPSKTFTYLAAGLPLLGLVEGKSDLSRTIMRRGLGCSIDADARTEAIVQVVRDLAATRPDRSEIISRSFDMVGPEQAKGAWQSTMHEIETRDVKVNRSNAISRVA